MSTSNNHEQAPSGETRVRQLWQCLRTLGLVAIGLVLVVGPHIYNFVTTDPIGYFSAKPYQLIYVAAVAIVGTWAGIRFARLPAPVQAKLTIALHGAAAGIFTAIIGWLAFRLDTLPAFANLSGDLSDLAPMALVVAVVWFEFFEVLRERVTKSPENP